MSKVNSVTIKALRMLTVRGMVISTVAEYYSELTREENLFMIPDEALDEMQLQAEKSLKLVEQIRRQ